MTDEHDDEIPPWKDPPRGARELILAGREHPATTKEEHERTVARVQRGLAALTARRRWTRAGAALGAAAALAAGFVLWRYVATGALAPSAAEIAKALDTGVATSAATGKATTPDASAPDASAPQPSAPRRPRR